MVSCCFLPVGEVDVTFLEVCFQDFFETFLVASSCIFAIFELRIEGLFRKDLVMDSYYVVNGS